MVGSVIERHSSMQDALLAEDKRLFEALNKAIGEATDQKSPITGIQVRRRTSSFGGNGACTTITFKQVALGAVAGANHVPELAADYLSARGIEFVEQPEMRNLNVSQIGEMPELEDVDDAPAAVLAA